MGCLGSLTPYCHDRNSDQMPIIKAHSVYISRKGIDNGIKNINIRFKVIDKIQTTHFCCGIESHSDWTNSEWFKIQDEDTITRKKFEIPESCW